MAKYSTTDTESKTKALAALFETFAYSTANETIVALYRDATTKVSLEAVEETVMDFITGRDDRKNKGLAPTPAQFIDRLERVHTRIEVKRRQKQSLIDFKARQVEKTPEQMRRVAELNKQFQKIHIEPRQAPPTKFRSAVRAEAFNGRPVLAENVSLREFEVMGLSGKAPIGSNWAWENGNVYGPPGYVPPVVTDEDKDMMKNIKIKL